MEAVAPQTHETLRGLSGGTLDLLADAAGLREMQLEHSRLDPRTFALVKIAALIALDAPPASYAWQVPNALADGASADDILAVLIAIAPQVGGPRVVAAAPEIMVALGLDVGEAG
jgi:alkylhydroperoxidase/carboxymuconolactone decarboxylase family protein YurZ